MDSIPHVQMSSFRDHFSNGVFQSNIFNGSNGLLSAPRQILTISCSNGLPSFGSAYSNGIKTCSRCENLAPSTGVGFQIRFGASRRIAILVQFYVNKISRRFSSRVRHRKVVPMGLLKTGQFFRSKSV